MNRFEFLVSTFGAGAGVLVGLDSTEVSRLGREAVTAWEHSLSRLRELDDQYGGGGKARWPVRPGGRRKPGTGRSKPYTPRG
ncbi:MAG: hypothetical protein ACRDTA_18965 [Pseudonocardiaceae bacterium]